MLKTKLTLYIDKDTSNLIKNSAKLSGKSISSIVKDYFINKDKKIKNIEISKSVSKWIGIINHNKSYKELRDIYVNERVAKYENIN